MIDTRLVRTLVTALLLSLFAVAVAEHAPYTDAGFDPFVQDSGFVDIVRNEEGLSFVLQEEEGSLPAEISSDLLPLDDDVFTDESGLLEQEHSVTLYGGLAVETGNGWAVVQLEGDADAIHDAILSRLARLNMTIEEDGAIGGPVRSYRLIDGDANWRIAISGNGEGALVHLQEMN